MLSENAIYNILKEGNNMMKQYTTLLFDVDDTLLDFDAAEAVALPLVCKEFGLTYNAAIETGGLLIDELVTINVELQLNMLA